MTKTNIRNICVIVAHPDDETLWAGGKILMHPEWRWEIYSLCRASDKDRSGKFNRVLSVYGANGFMADLDDGPEQRPLQGVEVRQAVLELTDRHCFDRVITHGPRGEYTRHRRHEEVSKAVCDLWLQGEIIANELWLFAYSDGDGKFLPGPENSAHWKVKLPGAVWQKKYRFITDIYGFSQESWEARVTPRTEAFWCFESPSRLKEWLEQKGITR
jgi:LmbE family N-acetylglucosaminyl deacetylase